VITIDDAKKIGRIIATADSGCSTCVRMLIAQANTAFPEYEFFLTDERFAVIHEEDKYPGAEPEEYTTYCDLVDVRQRS